MTSKKDQFTDIQVRMDNLVEDYKSLSDEIAGLIALKDAKVEKIIADCDWKVDRRKETQDLIVAELRTLAEMVPQKETKTQSKVALLSGDVIIKKPKQTLVADKDKLIEWATEQARLDLVDEKTVRSFKWAEYKKDIDIIDGHVIDTVTGEIVEGVTIEEEPEKVVIK